MSYSAICSTVYPLLSPHLIFSLIPFLPLSLSVCQYHVWLSGFHFHLPEYPLSAIIVLPLSPSFSCSTFLQPLGISFLVVVEIAVWAVVAGLGFNSRKPLDLWGVGLRI